MDILLITILAFIALMVIIFLLLILMVVRSMLISRMPGSDAMIAAGLFIPWTKKPTGKKFIVGPPYPYKDGRAEDPTWFDPSAENAPF